MFSRKSQSGSKDSSSDLYIDKCGETEGRSLRLYRSVLGTVKPKLEIMNGRSGKQGMSVKW